MSSSGSAPKKRQSLLFSVKSIFKSSKRHTEGMTPMALAFLHGHLTMAKHLRAAGASPLLIHNNGESLASFAVLAQNPSLIRWLATLGNTNLLLNSRDPGGNHPLHHAVLRANLDVTRALLEAGAQPNPHATTGLGTPLLHTLDKRLNTTQAPATRLATVLLLLQHGAATDIPHEADGTYPLHEAVLSAGAAAANDNEHDMAILTALLDDPRTEVDVGLARDDDGLRGTTPLMYAAATGRAAVVRLLLGRGADPRRANGLGEVALHWAGIIDNGGERGGGEEEEEE
ncbi:ankyrin repeat-containing domain protein, partial [Parachaetomium inaequale]